MRTESLRSVLSSGLAIAGLMALVLSLSSTNQTSARSDGLEGFTPAHGSISVNPSESLGVEVTITPPEDSGLPGETLEYVVTVKNTRCCPDNYNLAVSDNAGWAPTLEDNFLENVENNTSENVKLTVTIPSDAVGCTRDNIIVTVTGTGVENSASCIAHVVIARGVEVSISPEYQENLPGGTLSYTVTVMNTGNVGDNYLLTANDNENWGLSITLSITVPTFKSRTTMLTVTIPENATPCTEDKVTVTAISHENSDVSDNSSCIAHAARLGVRVSISPPENNGPPGGNVAFTVTVTNTGDIVDAYGLTVEDNFGWGLTLSDNLLENVQPEDDAAVRLNVTIPDNALICMRDNVTVTAISQENSEIENSASCIAHALITYGIEVSISPSLQENLPGGELKYTVTVTNTGNISDNYDLSVSDNAGWSLELENNFLENVLPNHDETTTLTVTIPEGAYGCTRDNIVVNATSQENEDVSGNASCIAHVLIDYGIEVLISPDENSALPGENVTFVISIRNSGSVADNYSLSVSDEENWTLVLADNLLENVQPQETIEIVLTVAIPENAEPGTEDTITVIATSQAYPSLSRSDSSVARALLVRSVDVLILPNENSVLSGGTLIYTVTVKNEGNVPDNYDLIVEDTENWGPTLADNLFENVLSGEENTTTLTVNIPENVTPGTEDNITITATSQENSEVSDNASCIARALVIVGVEVSISPGENSALPGENVSFTVTVGNTGNADDNYDLTASCIAGWVPMLFENSLTVPAGENSATMLSVTIPENAEFGSAAVTVAAVSQRDPSMSDSDTCVVRVKSAAAFPWVYVGIAAVVVIIIVGIAVVATRGRYHGL